MPKKKSAPPVPQARSSGIAWRKMIWPGMALAVVLFYSTPLFDDQASIQWDMADVHYSAQKYFEQSLRADELPRWTPFEFSGMPFLADPQTAGWYPLHWPFFLIGITPRAMEWELALHAFVALVGMFLFARRLIGSAGAALFAAISYAFAGFFAGHSSHLGMFESAALAPWLLWAGARAIESGAARDVAMAGLIAGLVILAGHFQCALYAFLALAIMVAVWRGSIARRAIVLATTVAIGVLISAVQTLPALALTAQSDRAGANYHASTNAALDPGALATLFAPDFYGVLGGNYHGPPDITQFYFYGGLLLVPLAIAGFFKRRAAVLPALLIAIPLWYALGPKTGLYDVLTLLPGFKSVRAPVHVWFVIALGLALAAGLGAAFAAERLRRPWVVAVLIAISAVDLWDHNMSANPLAYARQSWAELYGNAFDNYQSHIAAIKQRPFYRIWSPYATNAFGPMNSALESHTEATYGYNPLELSRYGEYMQAAGQNPKLLNGLAVTHKIDVKNGTIAENPDALERVSAPASVYFVPDAKAARNRLATLDPAQSAIAEGPPWNLSGVGVRARIVNYEDNFYRISYSAPQQCLLRIAVPYYPGWSAEIDGRPAEVVPVDYALSGVIAPPGEHRLEFRYRSRWLGAGAAASLATLAACCGFIAFSGLRRRGR
jgi:hypothetical protein